MPIIKSRLFYKIGMSIFLFLKLRWRDLFRLLFEKPKRKILNHNLDQNIFKEENMALVSIVQGKDIYTMLKEGIELLGGLKS